VLLIAAGVRTACQLQHVVPDGGIGAVARLPFRATPVPILVNPAAQSAAPSPPDQPASTAR
jgi:hypothetical protein